ncbi:MAG: oxidoreductase [Bacteroidetes bacterium]|jgi:uncharacterized protein YbjT (DUF2867 family)|nr:oxidoreductase [Bacteroidota bacterium]
MSKTAIVIGATGLVGKELVKNLLQDNHYDTIKVFLRKPLAIENSKLQQFIIDWDDIKKSSDNINGDVVFCSLGTTIKTAGSQEAFSKVDYTYVLNFAEAAKKNNVKQFILVSSLGVSPAGGNFYLSVKRDVENALRKMNFHSLVIVRPSMLLGERNETRIAEMLGKFLMSSLSFLFIGKLKKYKAIEAKVVAHAMVSLSKTDLEGVSVFESDRLQELGKAN